MRGDEDVHRAEVHDCVAPKCAPPPGGLCRGPRRALDVPCAVAARPGHALGQAAEPGSLSLQNGVMSGLMQMLLLKVSAHITEQLGMAPGGEFREAFKEVGPGSAGEGLGATWWAVAAPANPGFCPRPARCLSASSTWATGPSPSPSRGPSPRCPSGRRSSWPGACVSCQTLSGRAAPAQNSGRWRGGRGVCRVPGPLAAEPRHAAHPSCPWARPPQTGPPHPSCCCSPKPRVPRSLPWVSSTSLLLAAVPAGLAARLLPPARMTWSDASRRTCWSR